MTRTKARMCDGKKRHQSKRAAIEAMRALIRTVGANPSQLNVYRCPHCDGGWHVGHRERRRK